MTSHCGAAARRSSEAAIKGEDVSVEAAGKVIGKAAGDMVLKGKKILQN